MTTWNYIIGNEKDFEGAPDWAVMKCYCSLDGEPNDDTVWCEGIFKGASWKSLEKDSRLQKMVYPEQWFTIAQRERVTGINDDRLLASPNEFPLASEKYPKHDNINHPLRYTKGDIECIDAIKAATVGKTGVEAVDVGHVIRYLWRYEEKDGLESVKKAEWYIKHLIKEIESNK